MKKLFIMSCEPLGEFDIWFDEEGKLLGGYSWDDANWREEYFNHLFKGIVEIKTMKYNAKAAKAARKKLWGF